MTFYFENFIIIFIRAFEYGFRKARDEASNEENIKTIYFPKQKVIFFEENKSIEDSLKLKIVFLGGEDFHKLLLAIQNLIEYLNRSYFKDDNIEEEVEGMTRTLYNPEVEKKGKIEGRIEGRIEVAKNLLDLLEDETIVLKTELDIELVRKLRAENKK